MSEPVKTVLITGAAGYLGRQVVEALANDPRGLDKIVAMDLREEPPASRLQGVTYEACDIRSPELKDILVRHQPQVVVHLAAMVTPGRRSNRQLEYEVDVLGTENLLNACLACGTGKIIVSSSGAAYGYYADNPRWLEEHHALRGNPEFAYSDHKRLVEEMLARWRSEHPELKQLILRPGIILGRRADNQITALFKKPVVLGVKGGDDRLVIIWDQDVVGVIIQGIFSDSVGAYNLAGDGTLDLRQVAQRLGKPYLPLPAWLLQGALAVLKKLGLTQYGPEQVNFLRYRPVLSNRRLKEEMGYIPAKTTAQVFDYYLQGQQHGS